MCGMGNVHSVHSKVQNQAECRVCLKKSYYICNEKRVHYYYNFIINLSFFCKPKYQ